MKFEKFERRFPSHQNAADIFRGKWASDLGIVSSIENTGGSDLFRDDQRPVLAARALGRDGRFDGMTILELGPLEGAHTYQLERLGAAAVTAIEANVEAFLKCLVVKEALSLRARFLLGDFVEYLEAKPENFDAVFCSGVLYHMTDPVTLIGLIAGVSRRCFVWTHYYDPARPPPGPERIARPVEIGGFRAVYYESEYADMDIDAFWGGNRPMTAWMTKDAILDCFRHAGFDTVTVLREYDDHPYGPCFSFAAKRGGALQEVVRRIGAAAFPLRKFGRN